MQKLEDFFPVEIGGAAPVWHPAPEIQHAGKDDDDSDDDDSDDDDSDDDDSDDDDSDDEKDEDELRSELAAVRKSLKKANDQSARRRRREKRERAERERESKKPKSKDDDEKPDLDEIRETARREGETAGITRAKKSEARAALRDAGVPADRLARAVGLLDLDDLDLDDDGLDGIDDAIDTLRDEIPELFPKKRERSTPSRRRIGDREKDDAGGSRRKPKSASEQAAKQLGY